MVDDSPSPAAALHTARNVEHDYVDDIEGGVCKLPSRDGRDQRVVLRLQVVSSRDLKTIVAGLWAAILAGIILLVICAVYKQMQVLPSKTTPPRVKPPPPPQTTQLAFLQHTVPLLNTVIASVALTLVLLALAYTLRVTLRARTQPW